MADDLQEHIEREIRTSLGPGVEELIVKYISGYLVDDAAEDEDVLQIAKGILHSAARGREQVVVDLMSRLEVITRDVFQARAQPRGPLLTKLDQVMDMSKAGAMSSTIAFAEGVDLESINKSKCACCSGPRRTRSLRVLSEHLGST